jgi:hypothetical protein
MSVLVGAHGAAQLDLGGGLKYVANIFSWDASMRRAMLSRKTQADDFERNTGGLAGWSGSFSFKLQFSDDTSTAQSAWQMLYFAFTKTDDDLKADLRLILQSHKLTPDYDIFQTTVGGIIQLAGTIVIGDVSLDCTDPEQPIIAKAFWSGDGALALQRA